MKWKALPISLQLYLALYTNALPSTLQDETCPVTISTLSGQQNGSSSTCHANTTVLQMLKEDIGDAPPFTSTHTTDMTIPHDLHPAPSLTSKLSPPTSLPPLINHITSPTLTTETPSLSSNAHTSTSLTAFLSFSEWKEKQEKLLTDLHKSLKAIPTSIVPLTADKLHKNEDDSSKDEPTSLQSFDTDKEPVAIADPIRYDQPLPMTGTGLPEDPLLALSARTNFASTDCSAAILRSSKSTKGASSILNSAKDRYMLTPCKSQEQFVIIELCEEINIDHLVLANYEFFSSMFKHVKISGSEVYPGSAQGDWVTLGTLRAGNVRAPQVFKPASTGRFFKYLRVDFLSHYGSEHYCPVSTVRVYGRNQMDVFRDEEAARISEQLLAENMVTVALPVEETVHVTVHPPLANTDQSEPLTAVAKESSITSSAHTSQPSSTSVITSSTDLKEASSNPTTVTEPTALPPLRPPSTTFVLTYEPSSNVHASPVNVTEQGGSPPFINLNTTANISSNDASEQLSFSSTMPDKKPVDSPLASRIVNHQPLSSGESIYGAITKRLNSLEKDVALTLRYVEEQGHLFQELFLKLESKLIDIERTRIKNEQNFKKLALEMNFHRARVEEERIAMANQVNVLASEIIFGKRVGVIQLIALLAVLALVAVTRGSVATLVNLPPLSSARKSSLFRTFSPAESALNDLQLPLPPLDTRIGERERRLDRERPTRHGSGNGALHKSGSIKRRHGQPRYVPTTSDRSRRLSGPSLQRSQTPPPRFPESAIPRQPLSAFKTNSVALHSAQQLDRTQAIIQKAMQQSPEGDKWLSTSSETESDTSHGRSIQRKGLGIESPNYKDE